VPVLFLYLRRQAEREKAAKEALAREAELMVLEVRPLF